MESSFGHTFYRGCDTFHIHPMERRVDERTRTLASCSGREYSSYFTRLSCCVYSYLPEKWLQLANDWHMWLWLFDDIMDDPEILHSQKRDLTRRAYEMIEARRVMEGHIEDGNVRTIRGTKKRYLEVKEDETGCLTLLAKLLTWLGEAFETKPMLWRYFLRETSYYLSRGVYAKLEAPCIDSLKEYGEIRFYDGACNTVWPLTCLDLEDIDLDVFEESNILANEIVYLVNDDHSYAKDAKERSDYNYLIQYMKECNLGLSEAKADIELNINIKHQTLEVMKECHKDVEQLYIARLIQWCDGSYVWHSQSPRYKDLH